MGYRGTGEGDEEKSKGVEFVEVEREWEKSERSIYEGEARRRRQGKASLP